MDEVPFLKISFDNGSSSGAFATNDASFFLFILQFCVLET
jgi:hypothetical protein